MAGGKSCSNLQALAVLLSLTLGWGLWLMPEIFSAFGWAAAPVIIAVSAAATWLSGSLYGQLCDAVPHAGSLSEVGWQAHGRTGQRSAAAFVTLTQILMCLVLQLAAATSLHVAFGVTVWSAV
jgi:amino acid permease